MMSNILHKSHKRPLSKLFVSWFIVWTIKTLLSYEGSPGYFGIIDTPWDGEEMCSHLMVFISPFRYYWNQNGDVICSFLQWSWMLLTFFYFSPTNMDWMKTWKYHRIVAKDGSKWSKWTFFLSVNGDNGSKTNYEIFF